MSLQSFQGITAARRQVPAGMRQIGRDRQLKKTYQRFSQSQVPRPRIRPYPTLIQVFNPFFSLPDVRTCGTIAVVIVQIIPLKLPDRAGGSIQNHILPAAHAVLIETPPVTFVYIDFASPPSPASSRPTSPNANSRTRSPGHTLSTDHQPR